MAIRALFFDLDGTLVDTIRDITEALNYALRIHGLGELSIDETKRIVGEGATKMIEKIVGENDERLREAVRNAFLDYYRRHLVDHAVIYPGVVETLETLSRFRKAVISNKREQLSLGILEKLSLLRYFEFVVGSNTIFPKKPSAAPLLYALQKVHADPREAVMIGDSAIDIAAGREAGVITVAVTYGYRESETLSEADARIDRFNELPGILDRLSLKYL